MMFFAGILFLVLHTFRPIGSNPFVSHHHPNREKDHAVVKSNNSIANYDDTGENNGSLSLLNIAASQRLTFPTTSSSEIHWSQAKDHENRTQVLARRAGNSDESFSITDDVYLSNRSPQGGKRIRRATSKFTGLVVGASRDNNLLKAVTTTLSAVESLIWGRQSQYSKPFSASKHELAVLLGSFSSDLRTNFHGYKSEVNLRRSADYSVADTNSLTLLLILQCLVEASLYGSGTSPAASNMSIAVDSLKTFYTHTYPSGSSIMTMWPERFLTDQKIWVSSPVNIVGAQVKDNTTFKQLEQLAKSCNCEPAKSGLQQISQNKLCRDYFSTPLSEIYKDEATPPDFLTSFSNLALGSLLHFTFPGKNKGMYKAESDLWMSANSDVQILIRKLKSTAIVFPVKEPEVPLNNSSNTTNNSSSTNEKIIKKVTKRQAINQNITLVNITTSSELGNNSYLSIGEEDGNLDGTIQANTTESVSLSFQVLKVNESSDSAVAAESNDTAVEVSKHDTSTTPQSSDLTLEEVIKHLQSTNNVTTPLASDNNTDLTTAASPVATTTASSVAASTPTAPPTTSLAPETTGSSAEVAEEVRVNQILSSESYYAIRNYLDAVVPVATEDVILIPFLITDNDNIDGKQTVVATDDGNVWHNGRVFQSYNTVTLLTTATTLHGIIVASMSGLIALQNDVMLQKIVVSSLRLLTWFMGNPQEVVTMVTLSPFPSRYQLYWVTARVAFQLNSRQAQSSRMFQFADGAIAPFVKTLRDKMTFSILQSIVDDGLGQDGKSRVYIDDFIGVSDLNDKGIKQASGDDRIFTSAMAINILIATWTVQKESGILEFVKDMGDPVRIAINSLTNYISGAVTDPTQPNLNAFMSEPTKNCETLPARYPANTITTPDGKELVPSQPELNHRFGVKGYIPKEDYQQLLTKPIFGYTTRGGSLADLNSPTSIFRFWSSPSYTKAAALLAIAQAANLQVDTVS